jgi:chromate transporter
LVRERTVKRTSSLEGAPASSEVGRPAVKGSGRPLREVALFFLRLGLTAFGGPAAHIAMMEEEVVRRRAWLTREEFLDLLGAANLIPGPSSTEMAIFIGYRRAGWAGLILGGTCFILPAALIVVGFAWAYVRFGALPQVASVLYGVKPVVIAVILQALLGLGRTAVKTWTLGVIALGAAAASFAGVNPLAILAAAGVLTIIARTAPGGALGGFGTVFSGIGTVAAPVAAVVAPASLSGLFAVFLKVGAVLFGSGYVLLAFLRADLVDHRHWLTESQLLDAVAVGQVTPGPVFTTATFIGYLLRGGTGALVATVGIFLPSFILVALSGPLVPRLRRSRAAGAFLDGVNVASLALMATVTWYLGRSALTDAVTVLLACASAFLLLKFRVNSVWLVLAGALVGVGRWWMR